MEAKVMGISNTVAYKKIEKAMGNQGDPLNFLTTFHADTIIAILMINHRTSPPIPNSKTRVPKPLSTPTPTGVAWKILATY